LNILYAKELTQIEADTIGARVVQLDKGPVEVLEPNCKLKNP